ncbi:MAG: hypothetical protein AAF517_23480 [Planctomycetota bacterium]
MQAQYLGGDKEDYEAINGNWNVGGWPDPGVPYDGDGSSWTRIKSLRDDFEAVSPYLDVAQYIDFMLMFLFGNSEDEYRCVGPTSPGSGFKFLLNDADGFTRSAGNRTGMGRPGRQNGDGPGSLFSMLLDEGHPDYLALLADRIEKHFRGNGALTPAKNRERLLERCDQVERAFIAEAARWNYRTPSSWQSAKNSYVSGVLPSRTTTALSQFRSAGFLPSVEAPVLNQFGGAIEPGFVLDVSSPQGTVYYLFDDEDPRLPGGALNPDAQSIGAVKTFVLLDEDADVRFTVPQNGADGLDWVATDFNDSSWSEGSLGIGYERSAGYENQIATDVENDMYSTNATVYFRVEFDVDDTDVGLLRLGMKYDDGFIAYLNGTRVAANNAPANPAWNSEAEGSNADSSAVRFETFQISNPRNVLRAGRNVLAIHGMNTSPTSSDLLFNARLDAALPGEGGAIVLDRTTRVKARSRLGNEWSGATEATFVVKPEGLRITEIMYNPPRPIDESPWGNDEFEFIEFQNVSDRALSLTDVRCEGAIQFLFDEGFRAEDDLLPGEVVVVVRNREAFEARYSDDSIRIAGEYRGQLDNDGERIVLTDPLGEVLLEFSYDDDWYESTDGGGFSLEIVDAAGPRESWDEAASWQEGVLLGSPGEHDSGLPPGGGLRRPGDFNADAVVDLSDPLAILLHLFVEARELPCEGDLNDTGNLQIADANNDGQVNLTDSVYLLLYLFRGGPEPFGGSDCAPVLGCRHRCAN